MRISMSSKRNRFSPRTSAPAVPIGNSHGTKPTTMTENNILFTAGFVTKQIIMIAAAVQHKDSLRKISPVPRWGEYVCPIKAQKITERTIYPTIPII